MAKRNYDWCGVEDDLEGDQFAEVTEEEHEYA